MSKFWSNLLKVTFPDTKIPANIYIYVTDVVLVFLLLTLNIFHNFF